MMAGVGGVADAAGVAGVAGVAGCCFGRDVGREKSGKVTGSEPGPEAATAAATTRMGEDDVEGEEPDSTECAGRAGAEAIVCWSLHSPVAV